MAGTEKTEFESGKKKSIKLFSLISEGNREGKKTKNGDLTWSFL